MLSSCFVNSRSLPVRRSCGSACFTSAQLASSTPADFSKQGFSFAELMTQWLDFFLVGVGAASGPEATVALRGVRASGSGLETLRHLPLFFLSLEETSLDGLSAAGCLGFSCIASCRDVGRRGGGVADKACCAAALASARFILFCNAYPSCICFFDLFFGLGNTAFSCSTFFFGAGSFSPRFLFFAAGCVDGAFLAVSPSDLRVAASFAAALRCASARCASACSFWAAAARSLGLRSRRIVRDVVASSAVVVLLSSSCSSEALSASSTSSSAGSLSTSAGSLRFRAAVRLGTSRSVRSGSAGMSSTAAGSSPSPRQLRIDMHMPSCLPASSGKCAVSASAFPLSAAICSAGSSPPVSLGNSPSCPDASANLPTDG
mmetsp:Transcript_17945/g.61168  ORF Transcript_17945/g.61168 Transcript_17945/m.61168 type:complete len:375 (+) Transcript_17945:2112-3236(+)